MSNSMISLDGRVCVITGVGKGIGRDCAKLFARQGAKLALITRSSSDIDQLTDELELPDENIFAIAGDVSDPETVKGFADAAFKKFGHLDVLVNNAGMRFRKSFMDIDFADWQKVMTVNTGSTFLMCQAVGKYMIEQNQGRIINMASIIGTQGLPELSGYGASKGAIVSLTKCLALEWAKHSINVNVIAPGFCETSYADSFKQNTELYDFTLERTPMGKWGLGSDVAKACLFLATDLSDYVTGEVLHVDGGWSAW
tara:strand:- start:3619 stop:4383 length:765 start_codon:yes stop_codon:yes gene_type:complete